MRNMTERALRYTKFTSESHPALVALIDYAAQRPGLEPCNYGNWQSYKTEANDISRQWRTICQLLDIADHHQVTDVQVIEASQWAYAGRMTWMGNDWEYTCGQYWPTEYRSAVIAVLRYALPVHEGVTLKSKKR